MYLLDTNYCSKIFKKDPAVIEKLEALDDAVPSTCVIVRGELMFMAFNSKREEENLEMIRSFMNEFEIYPLDNETADIYGKLKTGLMTKFGPKERSKRSKTKTHDLGVDDNDLWIAAVAKQHGLTVVSGDKDFERIAEVDSTVRIENWSIPKS